MITLHLKLKVTANNQLKIDLPATVQPGEELDIAIELQDASHEKWTDAEIREVMQRTQNRSRNRGNVVGNGQRRLGSYRGWRSMG